MAITALAGKWGWWRESGTGYPFRSWNLRLSCAKVDVTSFLSNGFSEWIAGFASGTVRAQGTVDPAKQLAIGQALTMSLGLGRSQGGVNYAVSFAAVLLDIGVSTKIDGAGELEIEAGTNGEFDTTFAPG